MGGINCIVVYWGILHQVFQRYFLMKFISSIIFLFVVFCSQNSFADIRQIKLNFQNYNRDITYNIPADSKNMPLVLLLHGGTQSAEKVWDQTSLPELSNKYNFILVAPSSHGKVWNDGRKIYRGTNKLPKANDVEFLSFFNRLFY